MFVKQVDDLVIYKLAFQLAKEVQELVKNVPHYWQNEDVKQIKRSSSSVSSNIAEGFSQRFYIKQFIHYLNIALASSDETKNHLKKLKIDEFIKEEIANNYIKRYKDLSIKILNFINYLKKKHSILL